MDDVTNETMEQLRADAEAGDIDAQYCLACCLAGGTGVPKDETESRQWMHRAAEGGHVDAWRMLGWDCGTPCSPMNWEGAFERLFSPIMRNLKWFVLIGVLLFVFIELLALFLKIDTPVTESFRHFQKCMGYLKN